jgi:hypothetical protein
MRAQGGGGVISTKRASERAQKLRRMGRRVGINAAVDVVQDPQEPAGAVDGTCCVVEQYSVCA